MEVVSRTAGSEADWERLTFVALSNIHGIDIQADNCQESRERLLRVVSESYDSLYGGSLDGRFSSAIKHLLSVNIIHGDGLTGLREDTGEPISFAKWNLQGDTVVREDYLMNDMIEHERRKSFNREKSSGSSLFGLAEFTREERLEPHKVHSEVYFKEL